MARALNLGTAALPPAPLTEIPAPVGRSTIAAIQSGIFASIVGGIDRLIEEMTRQALCCDSTNAAVFLTGGDAELFKPGLKTPVTVAAYLVLEGLVEATASGKLAERAAT